MIERILMQDTARWETTTEDQRIAVDETGQWLSLRSWDEDHARDGGAMKDLLRFKAAESLTDVEAEPSLSAEDYLFAVTASGKSLGWEYDGDPLGRGSHKREFGGSPAGYRHPASGHGQTAVAGSRQVPFAADASDSTNFAENPGVVWVVTRAPRYVMRALKSVYGNDSTLLIAAGIVLVTLGLAALTDVLRNARGA